MKNKKNESRKNKWLILLFIVIVLGAIIGIRQLVTGDGLLSTLFDEPFSNDGVDPHVIDSLKQLEKEYQQLESLDDSSPDTQFHGGNRLNILVTGVDSRLGSGCHHADANHVISIDFLNKKIDMVPIPRDTPTEFVRYDSVEVVDTIYNEPGNPESAYSFVKRKELATLFMKLTESRAIKGQEVYFSEIKRIGGFDKIDFWFELGFSQALGVLEMFGFENSKATLQVLRSRKAMAAGDYQRAYNQSQFIAQIMTKYYSLMNSMTGDVLLRGGLAILHTNMTFSDAKAIINKMDESGLIPTKDKFSFTVKPCGVTKFNYINFTNKNSLDSVTNVVKKYYERNKDSVAFNPDRYTTRKLKNAIDQARLDSAKSPSKVISKLKGYFNQRAWHQIEDKNMRFALRDDMATLLINAYTKLGDDKNANKIQYAIEAEKLIFKNNEMIQKEQ